MEWEDTTTEKDNGQKAADSATAKLSLTCLPDLVLHHIISGLEWPEAVALRQVDRACRDLVLRDHRPLQFVLTHLVPRALAALPPDLATSPYHAKYWDWFKRVQTRDFAMDAPLPDDDGRDEDDDEDEDDFELESDELELLKQEAEMPLPPPHSEDDSPAADAMLIDNQPSATSVDDDQDDDNGQEEKMEVAAAEAVAVVADDKVEHELNDLQACRLLIESRLHQLAIMEPTYWAACRNACTKEPWREAQIAQILSIVKKARLSVVSSPLSVGESSAKIRAYTRIGGQEAITVGCLLELVCPGDHRWTFHIVRLLAQLPSRPIECVQLH